MEKNTYDQSIMRTGSCNNRNKSIDIAIKNTRMTKVFPVSDSKQAETINEVMNDIYNGKPKAIALKKTFEDTLNESMGDRERISPFHSPIPETLKRFNIFLNYMMT